MKHPRRKIAVFAFEGVEALDLIGPLEVFAKASTNGQNHYEVQLVGLSAGEVMTESGLLIRASMALYDLVDCDTLLVPGGRGLREPAVETPFVDWMRSHHAEVRRVASVCTGIYALAASGLMNGRRVATHWAFTADLARRFPQLKVDAEAIFVQDGKFYSSAGVLAGVDLALALVEEDHGRSVAMAVAKDLVAYVMRPGGQAQQSAALEFQRRAGDRMIDLANWMASHLDDDLRVENLAARCCLSPRQFTRRFSTMFGRSPAAYVRTLRQEAAANFDDRQAVRFAQAGSDHPAT